MGSLSGQIPLFVPVLATFLLASCGSMPDASEDEKRLLENRTLEYEHCVNARVRSLSGTTQAIRAYAWAVQQGCRAQRERVKNALAFYDSDDQKEYMESLDLLTLETIRRDLYRMR